jgi:hypothetical protein
VVLIQEDDLHAVVEVMERDRVVGPVELVEVDRALVVAVDQLAGARQRIDLARVDLLADLLDQEPGVVALGLVERGRAVAELGDLGPDFRLTGRVQARRRGELAGDRVEDRDLVALFAGDIFFQTLLTATARSARRTTSR